MAKEFCGCCGGEMESQTQVWCNRCKEHVKPGVPFWEATWYGQTGKYCPFTVCQFVPTRKAFLCFNDWAGKHKTAIEVIGETPKRWRIQLLPPSTETIRLAGKGRYLVYGATALVPKTAVEFA